MSFARCRLVLFSFIAFPSCVYTSTSFEGFRSVSELEMAMLDTLSVFLTFALILGRSPVDLI